ncbi:MAG: GNAT family N-acetyltransferase [Pseudomonadota bacterium]
MTGFTIPPLTTDRLILRAPRQSDFEAYAAFRASPRARFVGGPYDRAQSYQQLAALIGQWALRGYGRWMVADRTSDTPLGVVGIYHPEDWPEPEVAWSVFGTGEGRGIAHEAARAARTYAYDILGMSALISMVDPANTRSVNLAKRLGATYERDFQHPSYGTMYIWRHPSPGAPS